MLIVSKAILLRFLQFEYKKLVHAKASDDGYRNGKLHIQLNIITDSAYKQYS